MTPTVRLVLRALAVGATVLLTQLQQSSGWDGAVWQSALAAGVLAALEYLTPLNPNVGVGKTETLVPKP